MRGPRSTYMVLFREDTDPQGNPLALVIYRDRSFEYIPHSELGTRAPLSATA